MRFANHAGRLTLISPEAGDELDGAAGMDLATASNDTIAADPAEALQHWIDVCERARGLPWAPDVSIKREQLGAPSPRPPQVFGIGLNYADHGAESGMEIPEVPMVLCKLSTSIAGPFDVITLPTANVDWEAEIVVVIGRPARHVEIDAAWEFVAGVTAGQDLSERRIQFRPADSPQFSLGKSLPGFGPLGPTLVTPDELPDPDDIQLRCFLNGEEVQSGRSSHLMRSIPELISYLSSVTELLPGDVIFTGTPAGIGHSRTPPRYLTPNDRLDTWVQGVGSMSLTFSEPMRT